MNQNLFFQIFNLGHKIFLLDQIMIFGAAYLIWLTFLLTIFFTIKGGSKEKLSLLLIALGVIFAEVLIFIIHAVYFEPRPFITYHLTPLIKHGADAAFPSGHTTIMAVIAWGFTFAKSKWAPLFLVLMLWVGFARIFVGVHYPLDILGGVVVGFISIMLVWNLKKLFASKVDPFRA
ncbi:phosphatase PAP2 family protein [Candidatus Daviesbacteria bacterium]|nr:phosphatase PAP2 family protein [Candidatus Daviesbacteria bacterium]